MPANKLTVQTENLDNGQWPDLFAYEENLESPVKSCIVIDIDNDYYSTDKQFILQSDSKFLDRGKPSKILSQKIVVDFFNESKSKRQKTTSGGISVTNIDNTIVNMDGFRQGIEITNSRHLKGMIKISAGTAGHLVKPVCYGLNESYSLTDNDYFQELNLFNPIEFLEAQNKNIPIESVITFPIVTSDANQRENYIFNGVIEPFPIRPVISFFSIHFPFEPYGISAELSDGNTHLRSNSNIVQEIQKFNPGHINESFFLDAMEQFSISNEAGEVVELGPSLPYVTFNENENYPYIDEVYPRGDRLQSTRAYDSDLLSVVNQMKSQETTYIKMDEFSAVAGFVYIDSPVGVDSIAYGGLTRR